MFRLISITFKITHANSNDPNFFGWDRVLNLTKSNERGVPLGGLVHMFSEITSNLLPH